MTGMEAVLEVMARLRDPRHGCPWDVAQTFATIAPYTIEEAFEVADAIERGDMPSLREELGDLLFQVVFHARLAEEQGDFDFAAVAHGLAEKMRRRHPHVFGTVEIADANAQTAAWEAHKARERAGRSEGVLDGVPVSLPALARAQKLGRRAARVGFDWTDAGAVLDKVTEESRELEAALAARERVPEEVQEELGDLLFTIANLARHLDVDAEGALRQASLKFEQRFRAVEARLAAAGRTPEQAAPDELERLWSEVKEAGAGR
ncbi:MAG TPA: nucleoside triphosphate pyrophosphohydrolase [Gammaproteobacteria bacterium]|nr:nucleoside triphosphate pyrophosphohydrolase [Gammaproteobacteria bacterium]